MASRPFRNIIIFSVILVLSCNEDNKGVNAKKNAPNISPDHTSYTVNSKGDSILTGIPVRIEGKYIPIDSTMTPDLLAIERSKEEVKIKPERKILAPPELSLPKRDTLPSISHSTLKTISSKGETNAVKYPASIDAGKPEIVKGAQVDIRYWGIDQNMANSTFWTMIQDKRGDLWFGSLGSGAIRFNGDRFDHFSESEGLGGNYVYAIHEDSKGNIWFGTATGGVTRFDGESFTQFNSQHGLAHNFVLSIIEDHQGNMWFGTRGGLCKYDGEQFTHYTTKEGLAYNEVISIYEDSKHQLWVGTGEGSGIHQFDGERFIHFNVGEGKGNNDVHSILEDKNGDMWFGTWGGGLIKYNGKNFEKYTTQQGLPGNSILSILEGHDGALWLGIMGRGVMKYDGQTFINYTEEVGLSSNRVRYILEDRKKNIWACTINNGINRINPQGFQQIDQSEHLNLGLVSSIAQGQNGNKWLGSTTGLIHYDGHHLTRVSIKESLIDNGVSTIFEDRDQNLWLGTGGGVSVLSQSGIKDYTRKNGLMVGDVRAILQDKLGHIWLGTYAGGVIRYDGKGFMQFSEQYGFISDDVYALFEDSNGYLWFGTQGSGVCRYDGNRFTVLTNDQGLSHNSVRSILEDHQGNMWFGTENGLSKYSGETFENYSVKDGLIHHKIFSMMLHQDKVWVVTQKGISIFDPTENQFTNLDKSDILGQRNISPSNVVIDEQNNLWAGNLGGAVIINVNQFEKSESTSFQLKIADIKINDQSIDYRRLTSNEEESTASTEFDDRIGFSHVTPFYNVPEALIIPYHLNHLTFYASANDWNAPGKIRYSFYLEGVDKEWSVPQTDARMDYRNLPYGSLTLNIKAIGNTGIWSDSISYSFIITPPWYHSWFAYFIYVMLIALSLYYLYKILLTRKLAIAEGQRLKEIDDLKSRIYTNLTHEFRTPLTVIRGMTDELYEKPEKETLKKISLIRRNSQSLLDLINQMLDLSKLKAGASRLNLRQQDAIAYLHYLVESYESFARSRGISLQFHGEKDRLIMDMDEQKMERIVLNLIANAIKFTPEYGKILVVAKQIEIENKPYLSVMVKDNGKGIKAEDLPHIFDPYRQGEGQQSHYGTGLGLALVKEITGLLNGKVEVQSELGEGSSFYVYLPISQQAPKRKNIKKRTPKNGAIKKISENKKEESVNLRQDLPVLLLIEDNADVAFYIQSCVENAYQVMHQRNGRSGLQAAIDAIPDIIICDVMMPEMDGFAVCQTLKTDERTNHIPIILLTAKATAEDKLVGLQQGADAYLTKPFDKHELLTRLEKLLDLRRILHQKFEQAAFHKYENRKIPEEKNPFLLKVDQIIFEHLEEEDFSSPNLASAIHLSSSQLYRKLKALTGLSTSIYIRKIRLQQALKLLSNKKFTVSEVAYQVGFKTPTYFSQVFKEEFGESPSAFQSKK